MNAPSGCRILRLALWPCLLLAPLITAITADESRRHDVELDNEQCLSPKDVQPAVALSSDVEYRSVNSHPLLQPRANAALSSNTPRNDDINPGSVTYYTFSPSTPPLLQHERELRKRQGPGPGANLVFVTINTCDQPAFAQPGDQQNPPQLTLFVSTSSSNQQPGPGATSSETVVQPLVQGFANVTVQTSSTVYIGVAANQVKVTSGAWNYDIAASSDSPYHAVNDSLPLLFLIDSDRTAGLLITRNLTDVTTPYAYTADSLASGPPLSLFVQSAGAPGVVGIYNSYCGLSRHAQIKSTDAADGIEAGVVSYPNYSPEQQFYVPNLQAGSTYLGFLARTGNNSHYFANVPGGGGVVYSAPTPMTFDTKIMANCELLYNLSFCSSVAYAAPANPATFSTKAELAALYDNSTQQNYQNFNYSLQQIACNTTATAQYSLVKNCNDCAAAYRTWLCAVSIPRCADWTPPDEAASLNRSYLMPRNAAQVPIAATPDIVPVTNNTLLDWLATNSSRNNATIAGKIQPGPYMEVLPCADLCYELVRSCPAALGFGCPNSGKGLESSYGEPGAAPDGGVKCNVPGAVWGQSGAGRVGVGYSLLISVLLLIQVCFWL